MDNFSFLGNGDIGNFDHLFEQFCQNPESVDESWRRFFEGFEFSKANYNQGVIDASIPEAFQKEVNVLNLIGAYRQRGHLFAKTNPIRPRRLHEQPIQLENFNLNEGDFETVFQAGSRIGLGPTTLREIVDFLGKTYCGSIGAEYKFVRTPHVVDWIQSRVEQNRNHTIFNKEEKQQIYEKLMRAVDFEAFLHTKFVGQKRFSLEGAEAIIPALETIVEEGAVLGVKEFVIGMAHRGRLNVLANILNKSYENIFAEFEGKSFGDSHFEGDVKYHMGYSSDRIAHNGEKVHLSLAPNPSHLEAVNPVVEGIARAKIEKRYSGDEKKLVPILIHGDASIAGQGIIYEVLQMSQLEGYKTGGTVHVVLNNQVGFTTDYIESRSSTYCTDIAKTTLSPVFHVNGDDIEAVVHTIEMALEFRQQFHRDVFVDILAYRKHGHNEGDEPRFTQPTLYELIGKHPNPKLIYRNQLIDEGTFSGEELDEIDRNFREQMNSSLELSHQREQLEPTSFFEGDWQGLRLAQQEEHQKSPDTGVDRAQLHKLAKKLTTLPEDWKIFPKIRNLYKDRSKMVNEREILDWGMGEQLAYASLLEEGTGIRISGQDVRRGTFSHRHAVVVEEDDTKHFPLMHLSNSQGLLSIYNSHLSEYGVLGFEYGYAVSSPKDLVIWEAQFGDFANGAQIIIDQFIASAETKWQRMNGLVLQLPHGYEGQGPEHSSARIERFMTLCADNNMYILNCTTPANLFHALRRQTARPFRKPLVIFTPKSLLRHPKCVSSLNDFEKGTCFQEIIDDNYADPAKVKRVLFCNGKIYYDLLERQHFEERKDVAVVRLEQLYPMATEQIMEIRNRYVQTQEWFWVQEEPENMGAAGFMMRKFPDLGSSLKLISRKESSSPSTGFSVMHKRQQEELIHLAFA
ncbi:MAG: 2-oxoglutarate dehydrogenase E1 component [Deltaproteobacteria bacterium]|nr:2-oxoglutarate dehydrogenase E1 component [Deltaproteobacteria bacterium]